ncbi:porin [Mesorhizobium australicum]|uniref:Porin n=1 Tax=Mesorhizobium australicum TaxID=536018 RepID=A0A1X7NY45_9HYPH|nr:porin [Mesorhizobium australicum]SMH43302.1 Porin subfamily protein [Mesorhizobium australicum]
MKSLKFLSIAGALSVSPGAVFAADAVLAPEPEPVEYVRVCDAYGAGFFYIPGTETCLQISGYVWYQIGAASDGETPNYNGFEPDGWNKGVRARVNFDARSETEWGTLRSYIRLQADWSGTGSYSGLGANDGPVGIHQAWLSLGGFRAGYSESAWSDTVVGEVGTFGSHSDNAMSFGDQRRAIMQYNFERNGFFGVLSLEDDNYAGAGALDNNEGFMPDVVAVLGYAGGWGGVWGRIGYDESFDGSLYQVSPGVYTVNSGGFGASLGLQVNVPNMEGSSFRLIGYYADGDHTYGTLHGPAADAFGGNGNSEWSILASYGHQFTETFGASVGYQYFSDFYEGGRDVKTGLNGQSAELSLVWVPVTNFEVRSEVQYDKIETLDGTVSGYLRFTRFF